MWSPTFSPPGPPVLKPCLPSPAVGNQAFPLACPQGPRLMPGVLDAAHFMGSHQHPPTYTRSSLIFSSPCLPVDLPPSTPHVLAPRHTLAPLAKCTLTSRHIYPITSVGTRIQTMVVAAITHSSEPATHGYSLFSSFLIVVRCYTILHISRHSRDAHL